MIYGDKKYKEVEIKYPDINAILQANNLYVYCLNNSIMYSDLTGEKLKKEYVEYKDSKSNYYSYENSIGKHNVDSNTYKTETISDTNAAVKKEDEIELANDADKGVLLSVLLPSSISNVLLMKDTLSGDRLYDNEGRPLYIESGYTVRIILLYIQLELGHLSKLGIKYLTKMEMRCLMILIYLEYKIKEVIK